jgi:ferric-dicitrate binding protein FerR (iron transport regulator)
MQLTTFNRKGVVRARRVAPLLIALGVLSPQIAVAQQTAAQPSTPPNSVGTVTHLSGTLTVRRADGGMRFLSVKSALTEGDTLQTVQGTYARLRFDDGAEVVLRPDSQMKVEQFKFTQDNPDADNMFLSLLKGGMRSVTGLLGKRNQDRMKVNAPTATIGIRGTHFGLLLCQGDCASIQTPAGGPPPNGLHVDVVDGSVSVSNAAGQQVLNAGQFGYVRDTSTPPAAVPTQQGIQVTMPLAISRNAGSGATLGKDRQDNECAVP